MDATIKFLVVSDLFERYTIIINAGTQHTSVYCQECEQWVGQWTGDQLSTQKGHELYEMIVDEHTHQLMGTPVEIGTESFL